jgi:hypothetical protein
MTLLKTITLLALIAYTPLLLAHGTDGIGAHPIDWRTEQIRSVFSSAPYTSDKQHPGTDTVDGKTCMSGPFLNIDIDDNYAFDIDETLQLEVEFDLARSPSQILINYDKNGSLSTLPPVTLPTDSDSRWYRHTVVLERARFANRAIRHITTADLAISDASAKLTQPVTVCDIRLSRSHTTPQPKDHGELELRLQDQAGQSLPARVGLYDASGRLPLPQAAAVPMQYSPAFISRTLLMPNNTPWPVNNRLGFYTYGDYQARLPVGQYTLVLARGPEYPIVSETITIKAGQTTRLQKNLKRWIDMPAKGWYSGDPHIHYGRANQAEHQAIQAMMQAEDLAVANLLQVDDIGTVDFTQYNWRPDAYDNQARYALVPGQEGPRSNRGHSMQLNIRQPIHNPDRYYFYHDVFDAMRQQGGVTGYAHVRKQHGFGAQFGLALDVPFGLVDVVEVLQFGQMNLGIWFDFLNLGYRLAPTAGTDFVPLAAGNIPGNERSYVHVGQNYSVQGWFDGLKAGKTFATNGPMLELAVNGKGMGQALALAEPGPVHIEAAARLNPDVGVLETLELVQHGKVIASAVANDNEDTLVLNHSLQADRGSWVLIKAQGRMVGHNDQQAVPLFAVSAPVYISVNDQGFCQPAEVPAIIAKLRATVEETLAALPASAYSFPHAARLTEKAWPQQAAVLRQTRVKAVDQRFDSLVSRAAAGRCGIAAES